MNCLPAAMDTSKASPAPSSPNDSRCFFFFFFFGVSDSDNKFKATTSANLTYNRCAFQHKLHLIIPAPHNVFCHQESKNTTTIQC